MLLTIGISFGIISGISYMLALFPLAPSQKISNYRKKLGVISLLLGLIHAGIMIFAGRLSLFEFSTYQKCLPIISLFVVLTVAAWFYEQLLTTLKVSWSKLFVA